MAYDDMPITITRRELKEIIQQTVNRTLEGLNLLSPYMSRADAIRLIGQSRYARGVELSLLNPVKNGEKNSKVHVLRTEVEEYMRTSILYDGSDKPLIISTKTKKN